MLNMEISICLPAILLLFCVVQLSYGAAVSGKVDPIQHVKDMSLGIRASPPSFPISDYKVEGFVDGGSVVSFTSSLTASDKEDILYSSLFAQLAADYQYDRFKDTDSWNKNYSETLNAIGYVIQSTQTFELYKPKGTYEMNEAVLSLLGSSDPLANATLGSVSKSLYALQWLETTDSRKEAFVHKSYSSKTGDFQVLAATKSDKTSKYIAVLIGQFYFHSTKDYNQYLFAEWDSKTMSLYWRTQVVSLSLDIYSYVRSTVEQKLKETGLLKSLIGNLNVRV